MDTTIAEYDESIPENIENLRNLINHTSLNLIQEIEDAEMRYGRQYCDRKYDTLMNILRYVELQYNQPANG